MRCEPEWVPLANVAAPESDSFVDGPFGSNLKSSEYASSGVRLIQLQNIGEGIWIDENRKYISEAKFQTLRRHGAVPGEIAIAKMAEPVARACLLPAVAEQFVVVADCMKLRPDPSHFDPSYVTYAINSHATRLEAERKSTGTTRLRINLSALKTVRIWAPSLPEQRGIAQILDTLDEAIRKTEQVIAKLQHMKQGLLHDLLTRGIDDNGELRDPERHPEQFKDTLLGQIPKGWDVAPFAGFSSPHRPFLKTGPFGSSLKGEHWVDEGVPVITIGALGEGEFIETELLFVSDRTAAGLAAYAVQSGDIVFSRVADVGRSVVVSIAESGWIMSSNLMWISLDPTKADPHYVWLNLSGNPAIRSQVRRSVNAGGREVANGAILRSLKLGWPSLPEQRRIVASAAALSDRTREEWEHLLKLRTLKAGLMDDLLAGRVRVPIQETAAA